MANDVRSNWWVHCSLTLVYAPIAEACAVKGQSRSAANAAGESKHVLHGQRTGVPVTSRTFTVMSEFDAEVVHLVFHLGPDDPIGDRAGEEAPPRRTGAVAVGVPAR